MTFPEVGKIINGPDGPNTLKLIELLGQGSFGLVYKAKSKATNIDYAVKFPLTSGISDQKIIAAFMNEVEAAKNISHPNVVQILHVELNPKASVPYIVMEYVSGGTLKEFLTIRADKSELIEINTIREFTTALVDGMEAINSAMIHRDLKPDNILKDGDTLKIADFGLSKIIGAATRSNTFKGGQHVCYMAPEGWQGQTNNMAIDMYSMGIIFHEIATLKFPYEKPEDLSNFESCRNMHLFSSPTSVASLRNDLPPLFSEIVSKLMAKSVDQRFYSWEEVKESLSKVWDISEGKNIDPDPDIEKMLREANIQKEKREQERLTREKEEEKINDIRKAEQLMAKELGDKIQNFVNKYNDSAIDNPMRLETSMDINTYSLYFPMEGQVNISFFRLPKLIKYSKGICEFVACVSDTQKRGFNLLLTRANNDDIYGKWVSMFVTHNRLASPGDRILTYLAEPFGLASPDEVIDLLKTEIAMGVFQHRFEDTDIKHFKTLAFDYLKNLNNR